jgi:hypothetical protein
MREHDGDNSVKFAGPLSLGQARGQFGNEVLLGLLSISTVAIF